MVKYTYEIQKGIMNMYEWDKNKNISNEQKHGISFEVAIEVFSDPNAITQFNRQTRTETREQIIGNIGGDVVIVFVVFTQRAKKYRIISARKASKKERIFYENQKRTT